MTESYKQIVQQAIDLLDGIAVKDYQSAIQPHFPSSIGAHMRHIIDHFLALKAGFVSRHVDYNKRHRKNQTEQFPLAAIESLESVLHWLDSLTEQDRQQVISVTCEIDISHTKSGHCQSTLERELIFVTSHAIHHFALIRIMCEMLHKKLPEFFGYAPATITHINRSA
ncbi:DinB family protein [Glaciecola sp. 1036]|uniref:DinB family protein n=1 Tax=Alteromonadaceae TaxID=72275 RepID=UPI003D0754DB